MRIYEKSDNLIIEDVRDFDLAETFECGQCFRWEKCPGGYIGTAFSKPLKITQNGDCLTLYGASAADWDNIWRRYFDMDRDYSKIKKSLSKSSVMREAVDFGSGIRLLNQEPFECLISFIISASNNIPRIKKIIASLCENFGERVTYLGEDFYTFPTADRLSALSLEDLGVIKAGFRDKYILGAARAVSSGKLDLDCLKRATPEYARGELLKLSGVGNKVADCVLLFSLEKYQSFPIDVWVKRIAEHCFFGGADTPKDVIADFAEREFGDLGGFAQQYLFYRARENKIGI